VQVKLEINLKMTVKYKIHLAINNKSK